MQEIRDLLYFDFEKAASLHSQLSGGLLQETTSASERSRDDRNIRRYNLFGMFKPVFGGKKSELERTEESRTLHHDLLLKIEQELLVPGVGVDLNAVVPTESLTAETVRAAVGSVPYVRADGWAALEDYERIKSVMGRFNEVARFVNRCSLSGLKETPEYMQLAQQFEELRTQAESVKDRNVKAKQLSQVKKREQELDKKMEELTGLSCVDDWLIEGMGMMIDIFMPKRLLLRLYPFEEVPEFQLLANLKRDCMADADLDKIAFAYGNRPTMRLSVFGLITCVPLEEDDRFDPMTEFADEIMVDASDEKKFESGFRGLFSGAEGFDGFTRYSRYPNITIYPIAVYRRVTVGSDLAGDAG